MDKRQIDGVTYVPHDEIQRAFEDRLAKISAARSQAEERATELQTQLDTMQGKLGTLDTINSRVQELESQLQSEKNRFSRHTAMADNGWTDPDIREAVEWSYDKAMRNTPKKDQIPLAEWLRTIKENPDNAPSILRPHLKQPEQAAPEQAAPEQAQEPIQDVPSLLPPRTNNGARPAPVQTTSILDRGLQDIEFYAQNREAIHAEWKKLNQ